MCPINIQQLYTRYGKYSTKHQYLMPPVVKATMYQPPPTFPFQDATYKAPTKPLPGQRAKFLKCNINAFGDAQEALADKVERLIKLRAPATYTVPRKGHAFPSACQKTRNNQIAPQPIMNTTCRSQWMTEYKENFSFLQTVHSPPAPKKGVPPLPINLMNHPEARFADKYRRTQYQTAYGCKVRTANFNITLFRQIHGTG